MPFDNSAGRETVGSVDIGTLSYRFRKTYSLRKSVVSKSLSDFKGIHKPMVKDL